VAYLKHPIDCNEKVDNHDRFLFISMCNDCNLVVFKLQVKYRVEVSMDLVKKTIELDQDAITRIKNALNAKSEKEAINFVLR